MDNDALATPGYLLNRAARAFNRYADAQLKPFGFSMGHLPVLVALKDGAAQAQRDLARTAQVEQPSMAQLLVRMERDGVIERRPDPADGRSSLITLTERAEAQLLEAREALFQSTQGALQGFTTDEAMQLTALLGRLIDNLDRLDDETMQATHNSRFLHKRPSASDP